MLPNKCSIFPVPKGHNYLEEYLPLPSRSQNFIHKKNTPKIIALIWWIKILRNLIAVFPILFKILSIFQGFSIFFKIYLFSLNSMVLRNVWLSFILPLTGSICYFREDKIFRDINTLVSKENYFCWIFLFWFSTDMISRKSFIINY